MKNSINQSIITELEINYEHHAKVQLYSADKVEIGGSNWIQLITFLFLSVLTCFISKLIQEHYLHTFFKLADVLM